VADVAQCLGIGEEKGNAKLALTGYAYDVGLAVFASTLEAAPKLLEEKALLFSQYAAGNGLA
jgi:hypothetical protein